MNKNVAIYMLSSFSALLSQNTQLCSDFEAALWWEMVSHL